MDFSKHPYGEPTSYLDVAGNSLAYWKLGSGPDLVFIHGWPVDSRTFRNSVSILSTEHTCHLLDLPGAGYSRWSGYTEMRLSLFAEIVAKAVGKMSLNGERFVFVGHNSGGGVARMAVEHLGDQVAGYVLGNTEIPCDYSTMFRQLFALSKTPLFKPLLRFVCARKMTRQFFGLNRSWAGSQLEQEMTEFFVQPLAQFSAKLEAALTLVQHADVHDFDRLVQAHAQIQGPVRFLWGRKDPWFPLASAERMMKGFAGETSMKVVDSASLMVHEEQPELFAEEVKSLIAQLELDVFE